MFPVSRLPPPVSRPREPPPPNGLGPPGIPLYLVFCWYLVPLGISTHAMHILKSNSLPATCSYIYIYNYIYIVPFIPLINHLAISYDCILPMYYLHAIYLLSMRYLHKTYILSKYYLEAIHRIYILSIYYVYTIYMLPICYLYSILYFYYLSYICTFLCFFCIFNIYIYIIQYTYTYLVSYTILCQYSPHTPDCNQPTGSGGRGSQREPHYIYTLIYLLYM